jgi:hypothetical protein
MYLSFFIIIVPNGAVFEQAAGENLSSANVMDDQIPLFLPCENKGASALV